MKLKSYWGDKTVDELAKFVDILDVPGRRLHLYEIKKGCIAVICLCSITDAQKLKAAAGTWAWRAYFVQMGVLELFIGTVRMYSKFENIKPRMEAFEHAYHDSMRVRSLLCLGGRSHQRHTVVGLCMYPSVCLSVCLSAGFLVAR